MSSLSPEGPAELSIEQLDAHPANCNVMSKGLFAKLADEIGRSGHYPPVIVRPVGERFQILDGHHRVMVLRRHGQQRVRCVIWRVDDEQALLLLATLNRLSGDDDPRKRAALLGKLSESMDVQELARRLPEDAERVRQLLALQAPPPSPRPPMPIEQMPVCLHFFLLPEQRRAVERVLTEHGGGREQALLELLGIETGAQHG